MHATEGVDVNYIIKIISLVERLESLNFTMDTNLQTNLILLSLSNSFFQFIIIFNMNNIKCMMVGLLNMLMMTHAL